jgi:hypothetical protein
MSQDIESLIAEIINPLLERRPKFKWVTDALQTVPPSGSGAGYHKSLFRIAGALKRLGVSRADAERLLLATITIPGHARTQHELQREVIEAVSNAYAALSPCKEHRSSPRRELVSPSPPDVAGRIREIFFDGEQFDWLSEHSPVPCKGSQPDSVTVLSALFEPNALICAGKTKTSSHVRTLREWGSLIQQQQFIVPSAMSARGGKTKQGKQSARSLSNVGPRQYLVVEFDLSPDLPNEIGKVVLEIEERFGFSLKNICEQLLLHLARQNDLPLVLIVDSGGKSLHGWFNCTELDEPSVRAFFDTAVAIGADPATWCPCQWVRLPGGIRRESGKPPIRQTVTYFDPSAVAPRREAK